jgi:hypothetical protein
MPNRKSKRSSRKTSRNSAATAQLKQIASYEQTQLRIFKASEDVPRLIISPGKVHTFTRSFQASNLTISTTVDLVGSIEVHLSDFPGATDFTSLYDMYRITQVTVKFSPSNSASRGRLITAIDYDDASTAFVLNDLEQYATLWEAEPDTYVIRTYNPRIAVAAYAATVFTSFANQKASWIDANSPGVSHYGLKYVLPTNPGATAGIAYNVLVTGIIQCKSIR